MREPFVKFVGSELGSRFLLITCGLPATAKTGVAQEVSRVKGYPLLSSDLIRRELFKGEDIFDEAIASNMNKRVMVYEEMFHRAEAHLKQSDGVILDATFITQPLRRKAAAIAAEHDLTFIILQTECPQEVALRRIRQRTRDNYESNALTEQAYFNNKERFEEVDLDDLKGLYPDLSIIHSIVDTARDFPENWYVIGMEKR